MTLTVDAEQVFWWIAGLGVCVAVWCLLADTALNVVRVAVETSRPNRPKRPVPADHTRAS